MSAFGYIDNTRVVSQLARSNRNLPSPARRHNCIHVPLRGQPYVPYLNIMD